MIDYVKTRLFVPLLYHRHRLKTVPIGGTVNEVSVNDAGIPSSRPRFFLIAYVSSSRSGLGDDNLGSRRLFDLIGALIIATLRVAHQ